jgi:hypothetical protein
MKALKLSSWQPILMAFSIWFAHFMLCWAVVEIWPNQWLANQLAWGFTAVALLAMGAHFLSLRAAAPRGALTGLTHRFAYGAIAIATVAILFTAFPSLVFLP